MNDKKDIVLMVDDTEIRGNDILSAIDGVIERLHRTNDLLQVENALRSLKGIEDISGMGIARLLYGVNQWWEETDQDSITNDTFIDWAESVDDTFNSTYIRRCISIYKYESNGTFSDIIKAQPIKFKQQIASHLDQGYSIDEDEWEKLEECGHVSETGAILREIKGKPPRKNTLQISLQRDGSIQLWYQDEMFFGGYLTRPDGAESPKEREAIEKMISRFEKTGMVVQ